MWKLICVYVVEGEVDAEEILRSLFIFYIEAGFLSGTQSSPVLRV